MVSAATTTSELPIIEPEYVFGDDTQQLYPFVLGAVGDWDVTASVTPPEGFVADHDELWAWYEEHAQRHADLFGRQPFNPPESAGPDEIVGTNFERKYRREDRPFYAMTLQKK